MIKLIPIRHCDGCGRSELEVRIIVEKKADPRSQWERIEQDWLGRHRIIHRCEGCQDARVSKAVREAIEVICQPAA